MTDLETLRALPVPRPAAECSRFSRRVDSIWGFLAYGVLWLFAAIVIATATLFLGIVIVGSPPSPAGRVFVDVMFAGGFVGAWVLFGLWVRRRLGAAKRLFRDGVFVDGTIDTVQHLRIRGAPFTRATVLWPGGKAVLSIGGHPPGLVYGAPVPVLHVPGYGCCATFPIGGRIVAASR